MSTRRFGIGLFLGFATGGLLAGLAFEPRMGCVGETLARESAPAIARADLDPAERNIVEVFQRMSPAVVNIQNVARRRYFFDVLEVPQGTGTGIVWDKQGHVITNFHVVANAGAITVTFSDQTVRRADVVNTYPDKDLAVLKVDLPADKLTPIMVGTSRDLMVGQTVLAIGNPFGLDHSLSKGIVSALGRQITALTGRPIDDVIQTDAAINPGNSGGPLLDSRGRLIGINTAIYSPSGSSSGVGFAVPVDTVKSIVGQIIEQGRVVRPGLGVKLLPDSYAQRSRVEGAVIWSVERRSAAERAGLRGLEEADDGGYLLGDVITAIDAKKVRNANDLFLTLEKYKIGDEVEVAYLRSGKEKKVKVKLQSIAPE